MRILLLLLACAIYNVSAQEQETSLLLSKDKKDSFQYAFNQAAFDGLLNGALIAATTDNNFFEKSTQRGLRIGTFFFSTGVLDYAFKKDIFTLERFGFASPYLSRASAAYISSFTTFACFHGIHLASECQAFHSANVINNVLMNTAYKDCYSWASNHMSERFARATAAGSMFLFANLMSIPLMLITNRQIAYNKLCLPSNLPIEATYDLFPGFFKEQLLTVLCITPIAALVGYSLGNYGIKIQTSF